MKKVAFYTLGCKLNFSESSSLARQLSDRKFKLVPFKASPDIFVINTCSVTENADRKCRKIVRDALRISPDAFIAVIGCYAQLKPKEISLIPGVDVVLGAAEKFQLPDLLNSLDKNRPAKIMACDISAAQQYYPSYSVADRTRSFLKIQDGCDYGCAFCTIPLARGKSRSESIPNVINQAESIAQAGIKEIVLTGVNIGDFGIINGNRQYQFIDLIRVLEQVNGIERIRISSIEPNLLTEEIISFVAGSDKFVPHFHIPLQSGSDSILKKMRRRYLSESYADRIQIIKGLIPDCCIGADVLTGFPGESEDLFLETYNFLQDLPLSYLHVFTYSERPNTLAEAILNRVPIHLRSQRSKILRTLSDQKKQAFYLKHLFETHSVLFENDVENDLVYGFTGNYIRVGVPYSPELINKIVNVKLTGVEQTGNMMGQILELQTTGSVATQISTTL
jgi:threonylcarbamoyladenosine tRNA methylthiotransferase MtaB